MTNQQCHGRQLLHRRRVHPSKPSMTVFGSCLAHLTTLQHLNVSGKRIGVKGATALGPHLASLTSLQRLNVGPNWVDDKCGAEGFTALVPHIGSLSSLQHLNVNGNDTGAEAATELGPHLAGLTSLQHQHVLRSPGKGFVHMQFAYPWQAIPSVSQAGSSVSMTTMS